MQEPYRKGVAHHPDPESCAGDREGAGEALTGAHAGRAIELRNHSLGVPTSSRNREGHTNRSDKRELLERHSGVEEPRHVWKLRARKPGDPTDTPIHGDEGRSAKVTNRIGRHVHPWGVGRSHSTEEAGEQRRYTDGGARGGKGTDQGKR